MYEWIIIRVKNKGMSLVEPEEAVPRRLLSARSLGDGAGQGVQMARKLRIFCHARILSHTRRTPLKNK